MKRLIALVILLIGTSAMAQVPNGYTAVTATVEDVNGSLYTNGTFNVSIVDPGTNNQQLLLNGQTFQKVYSGQIINSLGQLSIALPDNSVLDNSGDTGSQWTFSICSAQYNTPSVQKYCFTWTGRIIGSTTDLTSELKAIAPILPLPGGGGGTPGGSNTEVQINNNGTFAGYLGFGVDNSTSPSVLELPFDLQAKGPDPYTDIRAYGARAVPFFSTNANCTSGSTTVALSPASNFINGDGILLRSCGPTETMTTPGAPSVTPVDTESEPVPSGNYTQAALTGPQPQANIVYATQAGFVTASSLQTSSFTVPSGSNYSIYVGTHERATSGVTVSSISDTLGNTFIRVAQFADTNSITDTELWCAPVTTSGSDKVTSTWSASSAVGEEVWTTNGTATCSSQPDTISTGTSTSSSVPPPLSPALSVTAGDILIDLPTSNAVVGVCYASSGGYQPAFGMVCDGASTSNTPFSANGMFFVSGSTTLAWVVGGSTEPWGHLGVALKPLSASLGTWTYSVIAEDLGGGLTSAGSSTSITDILTPGENTATISSESQVGTLRSITLSTSSVPLTALAMSDQSGTSNPTFTGFWNISPRATNAAPEWSSGTTFIEPTALSQSASSTGGTIAWFTGNQISWTAVTGAFRYYICGQRPGDGSMHLIGVTQPQGNDNGWDGPAVNFFTDWGATQLVSMPYPDNITNSVCTASAKADDLSTTIVSGAGTGSITVSNASSSNATSTSAEFTNGPAIKAAELAAKISGGNSVVYIPATSTTGGFVTSELLNLTTNIDSVNFLFAGNVIARDTIIMPNGRRYGAYFPGGSQPQFGIYCPAIESSNAYPIVFVPYANEVSWGIDGTCLSIYSTAINGLGLVTDGNSEDVNFTNLQFILGGGSSDYQSIGMIDRGGFTQHFRHVLFLNSGPNDTRDLSWTPLLYGFAGTNIDFDGGGVGATFNRRGMLWDLSSGGGGSNVCNVYRQGGISPAVMTLSGVASGTLTLCNATLDTEDVPWLVNGGNSSEINVRMYGFSSPGAGSGPTITGGPFNSVSAFGNSNSVGVGQNISGGFISTTPQILAGNQEVDGTLSSDQLAPATIYNAASNPIFTCNASTNGWTAKVSDATSPTYMGTYTSGGGITAEVICSFSGSSYSWLTH